MRTHNFKATLKAAVKVASLLFFGAVAAFGQQNVNLTAAPATATMPNGTQVPMWGYFCGTAVAGSTASCAPLNPNAAGGWSPVLITVPTGQSLTINLTNNLSFLPAGGTTPNTVPTSLTIVGQIGGGLGDVTQRTTTPSPSHVGLTTDTVTWSTVGAAPGFTPPPQGPRVQSFATEVAAGATTSLTWASLRPGTYLIESGTHPSIQGPMGLYGVLVVTTPPSGATAGIAYPVNGTGTGPVNYNAELAMIFGEIDPAQNNAVNTAVNQVGFLETTSRVFGGQVNSITVTSGGSGYTANPTVSFAGSAGSGATATAVVGGVISAIPVTNGGSGYAAGATVTINPGTTGSGATAVPNLRFGVASITVPAAGTGVGYAVGDVITLNGGGGTGASATVSAVSATGAITAVNAPTAGTGYTSAPTVSSITGPQSVTAITITNGGTGYAVGNTINFTSTSGTGAAATVATVSGTGAITSITLSSGGSGYTAPPTVTITSVAGTGAVLSPVLATGASLSATLATTGTISSITITDGGSLYTPGSPTVTISAPAAGGTAATVGPVAVAGAYGSVYAVTVNAGGTGFATTPSVIIGASPAGPASTATASASVAQSCAGGLPCYPSAVNYTPMYYTINGVAFNKTNAPASLFPVTAGTTTTGTPPVTTPVTTGITGTVLLRVVNAGLRMHVPAVVGSQTTPLAGTGQTTVPAAIQGFQIIAEDANALPGVPKVQNEVLAVPGKVWDLMFNVPTAAGSTALPIYDRELSLSANGVGHDAGMLAYIGVNGSAIAGYSANATTGVFAGAVARDDYYNSLVAGQTLSIWDPGKGVIANDTNVYGVKLLTAPTSGTVTLNANGTFTYVPNGAVATADTFTYCANGTVTGAVCSSGKTATVHLAPCGTAPAAGQGGACTLDTSASITAYARTYTANTSQVFSLKSPGVLSTQYDLSGNPADTDTSGYPLSANPTAVTPPLATLACNGGASGTVVLDAEGGFIATLAAPVSPTAATATSCTFPYQAKNVQGVLSAAANVTINFPVPSNLSVTVLDGFDKTTVITDYRWLIEEDRTFFTNPNCSTNVGPNGVTPAGCQAQTGANGTNGVPPILGANFHTSYMPYVAQGCTGPLSCEGGQTVYDSRPPCVVPATVPPTPAGCSTTAGQHIPAVCDIGDGVCRPDPTGNGSAPVMPSAVHLDPSKRYYISVLPGDAANPFGSGYAGAPDCTTAGHCGHGMGGAPVPAACLPATGATTCSTGTFAAVTVLSQPSPYPTAKLSIFVFEDDFPLNGEHDSSGGTTGVNTNNEPGLGDFQVQMWDAFGGNGDFTGQMGFDMFNQPLSNGLAGQIDPTTGKDACPISANARSATTGAAPTTLATDPNATGITGMMVTCPQYEADGVTPSPLAGQIVVNGLMPGRWGVIAHPGATRISRGEEWLQTNTLDGQKAHDSFTRVGEPSYFQEFGPASFHVSIGFANPAIINSRHAGVCAGTDPNYPAGAINCNNTITGRVVGERLSRTPDERLYASGSHDSYAWTQCFVSFGDPDGEDFAFTKCDADGNFTLTGLPDGDWRITTFDQWNDQLVDGLSTPVRLGAGGTATITPIGDIAATQWQANLQTRTFIDDNNSGVATPTSSGIPFANVAVRLRDGSLENLLATDFTGTANFNETFPLFSWYTVETDVTRYKNTGIHVVYDVGGPADGSPSCGTTGYPPCGSSTIGRFLANTAELVSVPTALRIPGAVYCEDADCSTRHMDTPTGGGPTASAPPSVCTTSTGTPPLTTCQTQLSSGRIDPPSVGMEGWQGFTGQFNFMEFGKKPYAAATATTPAETGGIHGHVEYASTRPFDDPQQLVQTQWTPMVPNVTINLYQEGYAADGVTPTLKLVDTTKTSSFDDWAQGFRHNPPTAAGPGTLITDASGAGIPNISCPGQGASTGVIPDLFFFTLYDQPVYLDYYNNVLHGASANPTPLPNHSQFKCYDGMHNWNQIQPAPYDGAYSFPSVVGIDNVTGRPAGIGTAVNPAGGSVVGSNCTICVPNPDTTDHFRVGTPMLPAGKYVVEIVMPPGYELVKEEDKNILIGDNFIAPVTQEFGGLGNIFIIPDQATIATTYGSVYNPQSPAVANAYNPNNPQNPTQAFGTGLQNGIVPGFVPEPIWPCVGETRVVPDYISLFPQTKQVSPFAGATRNLCDRKEVTLSPQTSAIAKFFIYTSTHIASKFTGGITDDYTSEFDPFSPTFGEKFSPPDMPISVKDWTGNEISRVYADHYGSYDGMVFSTWEVNPPNPTGYAPGMMTFCMNDPGPVLDTRAQILSPTGTLIANPNLGKMVTDPLFVDGYSQFCYELPFMPGTTQYLDTPVVPTSAFAGVGYNNVDCSYPDATPAVSEVDGDGLGPWVSAPGNTLTIHALGDQMVPNYAYSGPAATVSPYNQKFIRRHYGFGTQAPAGGAGGPSGSVTIGGVTAPVTSWNDTTITVTVPNGVPPCPVQQQAQYLGSAAQCGELVISTAAANAGGNATGVNINNPGRYRSGFTPTVTFTGGGGSGAAGTANMTSCLCVMSVTMTAGGNYPTGTPTVTFSLPQQAGGVRATGTAVRSAFGTSPRTVIAVNVTNPGSGYTAPPTITFSGGGSGATATAVLGQRVASVTITAGGSYATAPNVTFSLPTPNTVPASIRATGTAAFTPRQTYSGKQSIDTVTVTIGGKAPTHVAPSASVQAAIDAAMPGDMLILDPSFTPAPTAPAGTSCAGVAAPTATCIETTAAHNELLIMWKPVRLQGVAAATSIINANAHPAGKMDDWRRRVDCLFGLGMNGSPISSTATTAPNAAANPFDPSGTFKCDSSFGFGFNPYDQSATGAGAFNPQVDRLPLEATVGWSSELNGNLAELLQEPALMGALEGAGITVLAKGVAFTADPYNSTLLAGFPTGTTLLQNTLSNPNGAQCTTAAGAELVPNPFPSNYSCNPSSIDALGITDSSQGGGGIFVHGWGHNLQIGNNRIYDNAGTLSGGINLGQGEFAPAYLQGAGALNAAPGSCEESPVPNAILPYCENVNVNMHNNYVVWNSSTGDELFSAAPAGAGGVSICTGADYYKFNYNWVCGNLTSGDGGGVGHIGFTYNGDIEHNTIIFNQSSNPTIPTNGGGLMIMGAPDADILCNQQTNPQAIDQDCAPFGAPQGTSGNTAVSAVGPSDGAGPGLVVNANLIMGNTAESGTGAGIAFSMVNGSDMVSFPTDPGQWNTVLVTNNIIVDNVGGWDGAGISLYDSPNVNIINNTIAFNNSTASAGLLFNTLQGPVSGQGGTNGPTSCSTATTTCPEVAGLVALQHSAVLVANLPANITCPAGHFQTTQYNGSCKTVSYPKLENNIFWKNSSYYIGVGALSPQFQQNVVSLYNAFTNTPVTSQPAADATTNNPTGTGVVITGGTGACVSATSVSSVWDIGVRGDVGPTNHGSGITLRSSDSVLTPGGSSVIGGGNSGSNPNFLSQYCNGSRTPPEAVTAGVIPAAAAGWAVPPGIADATVPNPVFNLTPAATVDEGNNWVNMRYGPLSMTNPTVIAGANGNYGGGNPLGNYSISAGSSAVGRVTGPNYTDAPAYDFFNAPRKTGAVGSVDAGAVELGAARGTAQFTLSPALVDFGLVPAHSPTTLDQDVQVINTGGVPLTFGSNGTINCVSVPTCSPASFSIQPSPLSTCAGTTLAPGESCVINVVFNPVSTSQAPRNANLSVNAGGVTQVVSLTGHDTIATVSVTPPTAAIIGALTTVPANATAKTATITITNTMNLCQATPCPAGSSLDAGPWVPSAITLTQLTGPAGAFTTGGTCAVGTPVNPGVVGTPNTPGGSCTITITYTPPVGTAGAALNGSAHLTVTGYGTVSTAPVINATYTAN